MLRSTLAIVLIGLGLPVLAAPCAGFADVEDSDPFCPNVTWIKNRNITLGCAPGVYCPGTGVSRLAMAAFLNRLGDVLLPPNVSWVAPIGGQYQSIQAAISAASVGASATQRRLIKVAPGEYLGPIVMAPYVDVEGSGPDATSIVANGCVFGAAVATVQLSGNAQLRGVRVVGVEGGGGACTAVLLTLASGSFVTGVVLRDAVVEMHGLGPPPRPSMHALRVVGSAFNIELDNVRVSAVGGQPSIGMSFERVGSVDGKVTVRNSWAIASGTPQIAISASNSIVSLDRVDIRTTGLSLPVLLEAKSQSRIAVREAFMGALGGTISADSTSRVTIANTEFFALTPPWPGVSCYNVYERGIPGDSIAPVTC